MISSLSFRITTFSFASMAIDLAQARFLEESPISASTSHVTYREVAFICIFVTGKRSRASSHDHD